jgi:hypothetical protein
LPCRKEKHLSQQPPIDLTEVGIKTATLTVKSVEPVSGKYADKLSWVQFEEIKGRKIKCWNNLKERFLTPLAAGQSAEAEIEVKDDQDAAGNPTKVVWLNSFGGLQPRENRSKGGGGGKTGSGYTSKSAEEIHASSIAGIVKSAFEYASQFDQEIADDRLTALIKVGVEGYVEGIKRCITDIPRYTPKAQAEGQPEQSEKPATDKEIEALCTEFDVKPSAAKRLISFKGNPSIAQLRKDFTFLVNSKRDISEHINTITTWAVPKTSGMQGAS